MNCTEPTAVVHVTTCDELRAILMAYLFDSETYTEAEECE
jgi:hypothetical protein